MVQKNSEKLDEYKKTTKHSNKAGLHKSAPTPDKEPQNKMAPSDVSLTLNSGFVLAL